MIGQYLSNNNKNATVAFCQKFWHPNGALLGLWPVAEGPAGLALVSFL
jgi:hypothetical protein